MSPVGLPTTDLPRRKQGPPELWIFESLLPTGALARYSNFVVFLFKSQEQDRGWTQALRKSQEDKEWSVRDSYKRGRRVRTRQSCSFRVRIHLWRTLIWSLPCNKGGHNNRSDHFQSREVYIHTKVDLQVTEDRWVNVDFPSKHPHQLRPLLCQRQILFDIWRVIFDISLISSDGTAAILPI